VSVLPAKRDGNIVLIVEANGVGFEPTKKAVVTSVRFLNGICSPQSKPSPSMWKEYKKCQMSK
jgi:hypothetical protein